VIKQTAQNSVQPNPEMRDHTQENQKNNEKKMFSKSFLS